MQIFAGLGNPGAGYAGHRHNIGFMALDRIAEAHGFGPWRNKFQGLVSEGRLAGGKLVLLKPGTFMNRSGQSVGEAMRFYKLAPTDITVFHDELDLAPGKCRVKTGGGHAGHNGLRSIHGHIGEAYTRVRMGIGHPGRKELVAGYVLHDFARADAAWLEDLLTGVADGAPALAEGDPAGFQNAVALRTRPQRASSDARPPKGARAKPSGQTAPDGAGPARGTDAPKTPADQSRGEAPGPEPAPDTAEDAPRSPLQRLVDRFR